MARSREGRKTRGTEPCPRRLGVTAHPTRREPHMQDPMTRPWRAAHHTVVTSSRARIGASVVSEECREGRMWRHRRLLPVGWICRVSATPRRTAPSRLLIGAIRPRVRSTASINRVTTAALRPSSSTRLPRTSPRPANPRGAATSAATATWFGGWHHGRPPRSGSIAQRAESDKRRDNSQDARGLTPVSRGLDRRARRLRLSVRRQRVRRQRTIRVHRCFGARDGSWSGDGPAIDGARCAPGPWYWTYPHRGHSQYGVYRRFVSRRLTSVRGFSTAPQSGRGQISGSTETSSRAANHRRDEWTIDLVTHGRWFHAGDLFPTAHSPWRMRRCGPRTTRSCYRSTAVPPSGRPARCERTHTWGSVACPSANATPAEPGVPACPRAAQ
jgi:hypothetical protein